MRRNFLPIILCLLSGSVFALPDDQYQPIEIHADSAIRDEKQGLTIYEGNVFMKQGSLQVNADKITVKNTADRVAYNLIALGKPARFQQKPEADKDIVFASAKTIIYLLDDGKIELIDQALLTQGEAKISSDRIVYLSNEQLFTAEKISNTKTESQRVQVIIPAKKRPEPSSEDNKEQEKSNSKNTVDETSKKDSAQ